MIPSSLVRQQAINSCVACLCKTDLHIYYLQLKDHYFFHLIKNEYNEYTH